MALLDGVTGSGKTEVYFEAVAETLRRRQQALILLPEIALTGAFLDRFAARFGSRPAEWHSEVGTRRNANGSGARCANGEARAVVGARSALFLPFPDLGLIVVDEEHDSAYKQEEGVAYHARDMAVVRANLSGFPVVLSSATPSVETPRQRRPRALRASETCRRASASPSRRKFRPSTCKQHPPDRGALAFAAACAGGHRDDRQRANRRCCS